MESGKTKLPSETPHDESATRLENPPRLPAPEVLRTFNSNEGKLLRGILGEPIEYIPHPFLESPIAEQFLTGPLPEPGDPHDEPPLAAGDSGMYRLFDEHDLPPKLDREKYLFLRLNYGRRQLVELLRRHAGRRLNVRVARETLRWGHDVQATRSLIVRENLGLVLAMARRTRIHSVDPCDLVSEGNLALLRAVSKFDCGRGYRFSTYACRAILKAFSRVATRTSRYRGRFPTEYDPALEQSDQAEQRRSDVERRCVDELRSILRGQLGNLSETERAVIRARFALDDEQESGGGTKGKTLEEVGALIGVTKERVRQIQNKALGKIRLMLDHFVLS